MAVDPLSAGSTVVDLAPAPVVELLPLAASTWLAPASPGPSTSCGLTPFRVVLRLEPRARVEG